METELGVAALIISLLTFAFTAYSFRSSWQQQYDYAGASAAIAWRDQILDLHDRGLTPEQIRAIMLLEQGGAGYEKSNGSIDAILRNVPRRGVDS